MILAITLINAMFLFIILLFGFEIHRTLQRINKRFYKQNKLLSSLLLFDIDASEETDSENVIKLDDYK